MNVSHYNSNTYAWVLATLSFLFRGQILSSGQARIMQFAIKYNF